MSRLSDIHKTAKSIEFAGVYEDCTGSRMGFRDVIGRYAACLVCEGIKPIKNAPSDIPRGHLPGCAIAKILKLSEKP